MPDKTLKKLAELISSSPSPDLRRAAVLIAGEVGAAADGAMVKALMAALDDSDPQLRITAMDSVGKLRAQFALPILIERILQGGGEVEAAARAAGQMGARGATALEKAMAEATPVLRRRIASALGGTESAAVAVTHALLDEDAGVVDAAARSLASELPTASPSHRKALADHLMNYLKKGRKPPLSPASEAAMVRVLAALNDPRAEEVFWAFLDPKRPANVRAAALQALGALPPPKADAKLKRLLDCAADKDFQVAAPALLILKNVPLTKANTKSWLSLLKAPDVATRRFAIEKLQGQDSADVARALAAQLAHGDHGLRNQALAALGQIKAGRAALADALLKAATPDEAWFLARAQAGFAKDLAKPLRTQLFHQACAYWEKDDRRAEPLWFLFRECDADAYRSQIEDRALSLRKKKTYDVALNYLRLLARDPACGEETRFELAAVGLKLSNRDLAPEARQSDPSLGQFARLLQNPAFDLLGRVKKAKWLAAEDLFYLGFHFAEQNRREKEFGGDVLRMLIQQSPKTQLAKDSKRKLKSEGMD